jgi:hypothetical protein
VRSRSSPRVGIPANESEEGESWDTTLDEFQDETALHLLPGAEPLSEPLLRMTMRPMRLQASQAERGGQHETIRPAPGMRYQPSSVGPIRAQIKLDYGPDRSSQLLEVDDQRIEGLSHR